jgi:hypothetical protein
VKSILSVVAMVPLNALEEHIFVVEKLGLDVVYLGGGVEAGIHKDENDTM